MTGIFSKMKNMIPMTIKNGMADITVKLIQPMADVNFDKINVKTPDAKIMENAFLE